MNHPALGQLVNKRKNLWKFFDGFLLVGGIAKPFYSIAGGFCVISVPEPFGVV